MIPGACFTNQVKPRILQDFSKFCINCMKLKKTLDLRCLVKRAPDYLHVTLLTSEQWHDSIRQSQVKALDNGRFRDDFAHYYSLGQSYPFLVYHKNSVYAMLLSNCKLDAT